MSTIAATSKTELRATTKKIATILLRKAARTFSPDFFGIQGNAQRGSPQLITRYRINRLIGNKPSNDLKMKNLGSLIHNKLLEVEHLLGRLKSGVSVKQKE